MKNTTQTNGGRKMDERTLESRRIQDVESGAMQYGETLASRRQRASQSDPATSETVVRGQHHLVECKLSKITCGKCGENLHGKMAYLSSQADSYCQECGEDLGL